MARQRHSVKHREGTLSVDCFLTEQRFLAEFSGDIHHRNLAEK